MVAEHDRHPVARAQPRRPEGQGDLVAGPGEVAGGDPLRRVRGVLEDVDEPIGAPGRLGGDDPAEDSLVELRVAAHRSG